MFTINENKCSICLLVVWVGEMVRYTREDLDRERARREEDPVLQAEFNKKFKSNLEYWQENGFAQLNFDGAEPFESMADGKVYDSKSEYRKSLKANGYEEVGGKTEAPKQKGSTKEEIVSDIKRVMGELWLRSWNRLKRLLTR